MQCGTPVIASNRRPPGGRRDAGILVDPTDSDQLCRQCRRVVDESLRDKLPPGRTGESQRVRLGKLCGPGSEIYKKAVSCYTNLYAPGWRSLVRESLISN